VAAAAVALALIGWATLRPLPGVVRLASRWWLPCGDTGTVDVLANVALFLPLGASLRALGLGTPLTAAVGLAIALAIELLQYFVIPGRHAAASDVFTNAVGTAVGALLFMHWRTWWRPAPRAARALAGGATALLLALHVLAAVAFTRSVPHVAHASEWAPTRATDGVFLGHVLAASLGGRPIPHGKVEARAIWTLLESDTSRLRVTFLSGETPERAAPIVRLSSMRSGSLVLVQDGARDLRLRVRTRADAMRLRPPTLAIDGVLDPARIGRDTVHVEGWLGHEAIAATWRRGSARGETRVPLTTSLAWTLFFPFALALGPWVVSVSAAWNAALAFPVAWWRTHAVGGARGASMAFGASALALALVPVVAGGARARPLEWLGAALGSFAGAWLASRAIVRRA
jgi:hypothetical protein